MVYHGLLDLKTARLLPLGALTLRVMHAQYTFWNQTGWKSVDTSEEHILLEHQNPHGMMAGKLNIPECQSIVPDALNQGPYAGVCDVPTCLKHQDDSSVYSMDCSSSDGGTAYVRDGTTEELGSECPCDSCTVAQDAEHWDMAHGNGNSSILRELDLNVV